MKTNSYRHRISLLQQSFALLFLLCLGCDDPIANVAAPSVTPTNIQLTSSANSDRYEWPLTRNVYRVAKPPQMAFVTSFSEKLSAADPTEAALVPWETEGLGEDVQEFLRLGYDSPSPELKPTISLSLDQFHGPQAFDVSQDGTRLVLIDDKGLAMYRTDDGKLIGHMKLPGQISSSPSPLSAVRFAGETKDMLVASSEKIYRISSKDGSVTGEIKGCGEAIAQWDITPDDKTMLIRSESGRLLGGDTNLDYFAAYDFGKNVTFDVASLSLDGSRIGVVANDHPKTYTQDDFQIVNETTYDTVTVDPMTNGSGSLCIALGSSSDVWADHDGIFYTAPNNAGGRDKGIIHMFWKPLQVSVTQTSETQNSFLIIGRRFTEGKEKLALFGFGPINRNNSIPHDLDELPIRMANSSSGEVVAIADSKGLRVVNREAWVTTGLGISHYWIYDLVNQGRFDEIKKMLAIIKSQTRLGYGYTSEEMRSEVIEAVATRWRWLDQNERDGEIFKRLEHWREEGSMLAVLCSALRHYKRGWDSRGAGTMDTVTQNGYQEYGNRLEKCAEELDLVFDSDEPPPLRAFSLRFGSTLEQGDSELSDLDPLCRRSMELYPSEESLHESIAFKLTPRWFGDPGDTLSYTLSSSKMLEGANSDLLYARVLGSTVRYIHPDDKTQWNSYDRNKLVRGVREAIRRNAAAHGDLWMLWRVFDYRRDTEAVDLTISHFLSVVAAPPKYMDGDSPKIHKAAKRIRN